MASGAVCAGSIPVWCIFKEMVSMGKIEEDNINEDNIDIYDEELEQYETSDDYDLEEGFEEKKKKNDKSSVKTYALVFCWLLFALLVVVFFFYFMKDLPFFNKSEEVADSNETTEITYEVNANSEINMLITEFLSHIVSGNEDGLRKLVIDTNASLEQYLNRALYITEYSNITCYTLPGYTEDATIVYVTYNITIPDVDSRPIDIQQFYVLSTDNGYKIDNRTPSVEVATYINEQNATEDVQKLYADIKESIEASLESDPTFAAFYDEILNVTGN